MKFKEQHAYVILIGVFTQEWAIMQWRGYLLESMAVNINFKSFATVLIFSLPWGEILLKPIIFTQKTSYLFPSFHTTCQLNNFFSRHTLDTNVRTVLTDSRFNSENQKMELLVCLLAKTSVSATVFHPLKPPLAIQKFTSFIF